MQLTLSPEVEHALSAHALLYGMTPEALALKALRERFVAYAPDQPTPEQENLLDFLDGFIGVLCAEPMEGKAVMSEQTGKAFTRLLAEKRAQGRL